MNLSKPEKFKIDIISPIAMRGASDNPEIRINSLRGVLRWWLRASTFQGGKIQEVEENIFGSNSKASSIKLKLSGVNNLKTCKINDKSRAWEHPLFYFNYNIKNRFAFIENQSFEFSIVFGKNSDLVPSIVNALCLLSALGGIGARSRRGYGSISIDYLGQTQSIKKRFDELSRYGNIDSYIDKLKNFLNSITTGPVSFTNNYCHLSNLSVHVDKGNSSTGYSDYQEALTSVIRQMQTIRGNKAASGYNSHIKPLLQNFIGNHSLNTTNLKIENFGFGLPLSYQSRSLKTLLNAKSVEVLFAAKDFERMASPLIIKIGKVGNNYYPVISYFKNALMNNGMDILVKLSEKHYQKSKSRSKVLNGTLNYNNASGNPKFIDDFLTNYMKIF